MPKTVKEVFRYAYKGAIINGKQYPDGESTYDYYVFQTEAGKPISLMVDCECEECWHPTKLELEWWVIENLYKRALELGLDKE